MENNRETRDDLATHYGVAINRDYPSGITFIQFASGNLNINVVNANEVTTDEATLIALEEHERIAHAAVQALKRDIRSRRKKRVV